MNHKQTTRARDRLAQNLPPLNQILRGSLLHRVNRHKQGCPKCARGEGHLIWVLTVSYPGKKCKQVCLQPEQLPQVRRWLRNYRKLREQLEAISDLNQQLLRPEP
jgi:hypothetical protein